MRASGVLMPVSSLPSRYGIGCFSKEAYEFVDCLERAGQSKWQVLPLGPTGYGDSPYQPFSTFAGNPYFIDLDMLVEEGLLFKEECEQLQWGGDPRFVDYERIYFSKNEILRKAYGRFDADDKFYAFCKKEQEWLEPYCLFRAIKDSQNGALWTTWPEELRKSDSKEVQNKKKELEKEMEYYQFLEYEFDCQWNKLKAYANKKGITIIGDLPIYVAIDSADAWANPMMFQMDETGYPGMKVLQFAFDSGNTNFYLPHRYKKNCVVYTGTHDNDTTKAWYYGMNDWAREYSKAYLNNYDRPWEDIPWDFIRAAEASVADLAVIPMWDLLCCGSEGRMNHPSTLGENWKWRMLPGEFREDIIGRLRWLTDTFQRMLIPPKIEEEQEENEDETDASVSESV